MEVSAKRKKRNQFISVLIIVAIVLMGVIVWGWIELQKSRNAERIKNALNSQVEPGFKEPEAAPPATAVAPPTPETASVTVQDAPKAPEQAPAAEAPKPEPAKPAPAEPAAKPAKPRKETVKASELPKEPSEPAAAPKPKPQTAARKPKAEPAAKPAPAPAPAEPAVVAMHKADPIPAPPTTKPAPEPAPAAPAKAYAPEDLPLPENPEATEEAKGAAAAPAAAAAAPAESPTASNNFRLGMTAYRQQDYVNAIRSFSAIPKPASKKRGAQDRDEYVQANFLKGLSLLKVGHLSEAVTAFQNVLEYEKYYPLANMNLGICYVELKQYAKAHQAFEAVVRDQSFIEPAIFDDVMQRTKYFWALAWTRLYKSATNPDKQNFYRQQAVLKWKDYEVWFSKNDKYKSENLKAENYLKSLSSL
jgi:tetratricopeptide (TPR) repeat protein